uniref:Cullin family profile domain-containing protein n=1 Tax=Pinguiococcus pyrenoidosus TaxID=172671 RepID=A0A7R9YDP0_9STRA|mmetsp:Transcript_2914/g.11808  ORF Transcript_2914/g.11808 Transcript_2914/m.11808 type:complete len:829 (+) Transcript_2914:243-2729(+)|eukprot:scaffold672_cov268-Pinguiococcus_pyrenoidosus.AAC.4
MSEFLGKEESPEDEERQERILALSRFAERVQDGDLDDEEDCIEAAWTVLKRMGIDVVVSVLTGEDSHQMPFGRRDNMNLHLIAFRAASGFDREDLREAGPKRLYEGYVDVLNDFLDKQVATASSAAYDLNNLGEDVYRWWDRYRTLVLWLHKVLGHLDKGYVDQADLESLTTVALRKFHRKVYSSEMGEKVTRMLIDRINRERDGEVVDDHFLKRCIELFVTMGAAVNQKKIESLKKLHASIADLGEYIRNFQTPFLEASAAYWNAKAQDWLDTCDTPAYLRKAEEAIVGEQERAIRYLPPSSEVLVLDEVKSELLGRYGEQVLSDRASGCAALLERQDLDSLRRAYLLFREVDACLGLLAKSLQDWIAEQGLRVLRNSTSGSFVRDLIDLHQNHCDLLAQTFDSDKVLQRSLKMAYTQVVNADASSILAEAKSAGDGKSPSVTSTNEILVRFLDRVLRGMDRSMGEADAEKALTNLMGLFTYLTDKDFFLEIHRNLLCKRLLNLKSGSGVSSGVSEEIERERAVITAMKLNMGTSFTSKIEGMVNDFLIGQSLQKEYLDHVEGTAAVETSGRSADEATPRYRFQVQMLTTGFWPSQEMAQPAIPAHLAKHLQHFEAWYTEKHTHRTLKWIHSLGEVEVKGYYAQKKSSEKRQASVYTMSMSPFQALVLQHFDKHPKQTFRVSEIREALSFDDHIVARVLHGLCCRPKTRILCKTGSSNSVSIDDEVSVNEAFSSRQIRFRVLQPALQRAAAEKVVKADRTHAIDATLVRTMKARKVLLHNELVQECLRQLTHFSPEARAIKLRIESLIERDYLERDQDDEKLYRYVP